MSRLATSDTPLDGVSRVLFLHAHPDDETITTGALIAALLADRIEVAVLSATRGERGEVVAGALPPGLTELEVSAARENELAAALIELGSPEHAYLGAAPARAAGAAPRRYHDSGMRWVQPGLAGPLPECGDLALTAADPAEIRADVQAMVESFRPDLLITYDAGGGYGHPDHVLLHDIGRAVGGRTGTPVAELVETEAKIETDGDAAVSWLDAGEHRAALLRALRRHASQLTVAGDEIVHVGGQREPISTRIGLRLCPPRP